MIILSCNNISKAFGIDIILKDISFNLQKGEKVGLVGLNGAGKSTLFRILTGELSYDTGDLYIAKSTRIGFLQQSEVFAVDSTVYNEALSIFQHLIDMEENLRRLEKEIAVMANNHDSNLDEVMEEYSQLTHSFEQNNGYGFKSEAKGILKGLGFSEEEFQQPVIQLSGGEKTRLSLAKLLLSKPDILLLDEPTNHLDIQAVEWLEGFIKDYNGTVFMISHDRFFLDQLVMRVLEIENHCITSYNGNYTTFVEKKRVIREQQTKAYENQQKEIEKQKDIIRRLRQHGTEKLMNRAKSREKQLAKVEEIEGPLEFNKRARIKFEVKTKSGDNVLFVDNLQKSFDNTPIFKNVSFRIYREEKVALIGPNGIGKSTIFKILTNELEATDGNFQLGHHVKIGYYHQDQGNLNPLNNVLEEIWQDHPLRTEGEIRGLLGRFLFHGDDIYKSISSLSGGEEARISLLKLILSDTNFLLLDEPTNHLDIQSKEVLEEALLDYEGTILAISHDRYFLNRVSNKVIELSSEGTAIFLGNYDYYIFKKKEKKELDNTEVKEEKTKTQIKEEKRKEREDKNRIKEEKRNCKRLEDEIQRLEGELLDLEELMCQEEVYSNPEKSKEIQFKTMATKKELEELYLQWEASITLLSEIQ
ncbi:ABC-F family ATP-binding cassette domain-containing protein [Alkaliphilus serpentinus]|uniref:ABC-F family ATP-binding cassette domain-containing protein n=1 Tax=Alkaliphilus serpentinus TaxID=1482731 RepID=A0A833HQP3_9FIRM|nr:ABC-F family ATP-binding cassette domain-containing protein [Alkaliphilus serpentinus]KAB3532077.1 ABC-F family ATP-binding cassette domain-containing protein [Alkaliphilus serpentinus]